MIVGGTGTFLLNNRYASILFDTGADRSFVSTAFSSQIAITPTALDHYYDVELADGRIIGLNTILRGCTLNILNHPFNIDLMPIELVFFERIIGMDWLVKYQAIIVCAKKIVRIPWGNETLIVHGDRSNQGYEALLQYSPIDMVGFRVGSEIATPSYDYPNPSGIEDMVPTLWSTIKHAYDKDAAKGIKHWGKRRKLWYRSQMNKFSKHNVYSTQKILGVKSVSVKKLHGYGHLKEVVVKRVDRQLCKFKEGDFVDLHLNDIEDMLLLAVQHKLFHLNKK
ncbi:putative reverse transcriptase domain-containing protein [Tanacetum coccineum]